MSKGFVHTSRGESINMDDLINAANRPMNQKAQPGAEVPVKPLKRQPLNVRGHMPMMTEEVAAPVAAPAEETTPEKAPASSFTDDGKAVSMADLTGVRINEQKYTRGKKVAGEKTANETLDSILGELAETTRDTSGMKEDA